MADFLDQLGAQLRRAEEAYAQAQGADTRPGGAAAASRRARMPRRRRLAVGPVALRPVGLGAAALAAAAGLAIALVRSGSGAASRPPASQLAILGVLRRPQTAQDRQALREAGLSRAALAALAPRSRYVRLLAKTPQRWAVLVSDPGTGLQTGGRRYGAPNDLCLLYAAPASAAGSFSAAGPAAGPLSPSATAAATGILRPALKPQTLCGDTAELRTGGMVAFAGSALVGLVPDGVTRVLYTYAHDRTLSAPVHENLFWLQGAARYVRSEPGAPGSFTRTRHLGPKPAHRAAPGRIRVKERPMRVQWLGPAGARVGPPLPPAR
jgi:hypothetical protein